MTMKTITQTSPQNNSKVSSLSSRPMLKMGLDVHLQWIVAVAQEGHQNPKSPRKFTRQELVEHVRKQVQAGYDTTPDKSLWRETVKEVRGVLETRLGLAGKK